MNWNTASFLVLSSIFATSVSATSGNSSSNAVNDGPIRAFVGLVGIIRQLADVKNRIEELPDGNADKVSIEAMQPIEQLSDFMMKKIESSNPKVKDIFYKTFALSNPDLTEKSYRTLLEKVDKLYETLDENDKNAMKSLHEEFKKEAKTVGVQDVAGQPIQ
ncbi:hypothetical protein Y032_0006g2786 [Ancylostoma ceylanicum]|uniref:SXP/RAL-2 family protein Ani s 5-like cation-binding domain-containing protein n=1 Tax=Ancylostoma ceylanicum TaxID=53326 RepID=A0A016VP75_9BILA|nr:hypothetical protein Y032_0006g2786 [Ancylostoma ceylanicum]